MRLADIFTKVVDERAPVGVPRLRRQQRRARRTPTAVLEVHPARCDRLHRDGARRPRPRPRLRERGAGRARRPARRAARAARVRACACRGASGSRSCAGSGRARCAARRLPTEEAAGAVAARACATPRRATRPRSRTTTTCPTASTRSCSDRRWPTPAPSSRRPTRRWRRRRPRSSTWSAASWRCSRGTACSTSAPAGAAWSCTPPSTTACGRSGVTLSRQQADWAQRAIAERGLQERAEVRFLDYRDVAENGFDAVSSIGLTEHIGATQPRLLLRLPGAQSCGPKGGC